MIHGIGVDIEEIERFKKARHNPEFMKKVFTKRELDYCGKFSFPEPHLAARFAGKEAVIKAAGDIDPRPAHNQIEILSDRRGAPYINMKDVRLKKRFTCYITLSHSERSAVACSVMVRRIRR